MNQSFGENILDTLLGSFPDVVLILDRYGRILKCSENSYRLFGCANKEDLQNTNISDFLDDSEKKEIIKDLERVIQGDVLKMIEYKFISKMSRSFIGEISLSLIESDKFTNCVLCILREFTNQKKIETELRRNSQMFQLVMDNIPQLICWKDINSKYLGCNRNFARVAGVEVSNNIIGKTDYDLPWRKTEAESFYEIDQLVMATDKSEYHIIEPQLQADGRKAWLDTNKIPLHSDSGKVIGILCTYEDITERIISQEALEKSEQKYRKAYNRAEFYKDLFAHDISNILQGILTSVEISSDLTKNIESHPPEIVEMFEMIKDHIQRGANLITNVRKLSALDDMSSSLIPQRLNDIIKDAIEEKRPTYRQENIEVIYQGFETDYIIQSNEFLYDVFSNLFVNAIKYNDSEVKQIITRLSKEYRNDIGYVKVEVIDNGIGISDPQKSSIFNFISNQHYNYNRIGLGLGLVKEIIEIHQGKIWVEDRYKGDRSKGSNFIILLPEYRT